MCCCNIPSKTPRPVCRQYSTQLGVDNTTQIPEADSPVLIALTSTSLPLFLRILLDARCWSPLEVTAPRGASNPQVANNQNNSARRASPFACVGRGDGLYVELVIFSITRAVVKCSFSAVSPERKKKKKKNY